MAEDIMQGYAYSMFSSMAVVIHLILNFKLLMGKGTAAVYGARYRAFLFGILAYYLSDAAWGILAGLGWTTALYVDTIIYFLSLVAFVFTWCLFVVAYLSLEKWAARTISWCGYGLLAFNVVALVVNLFNDCFFYFDAQGTYLTGPMRNLSFCLLLAFNLLSAVFAFVKAYHSQDSARWRNLTVALHCLAMIGAIALQVIWPLTPFTALGCLIGGCFIHVFVVESERAELRRAIIEREQAAKHAAELEKALARARAAEKSRSLFFSIVSHDIRTPLNAILGYAELLQFGVGSEAEREEALKSIRASGTTLLELVNDVLDFAKMDAGKMVLRPEPMRLAQLTDEVFASFRMAADRKGIELVNRTLDVPTVLLDAHRVRQILFNLVGNAMKFTTHGSITVAASYSDTNLEFSVSDTGCGIAPDMLTHVLEPFFQVQDPNHSAYHDVGTGLGLPICRNMVEMMGGKFIVASELGKGSTFTARIPGVVTAGETAKPVVAPKPDATFNNLPKHVLVVDDSPVNRSVLTAFLKRAGVGSITHACDGVEAFAELDSAITAGRPCDFVFSDFWMPNMNGLEFIEKLHADSRFSGLPVFAVTADSECLDDARTKLFSGILLKPLTYAKLVEVFVDEMCR
ncbi:MAG: response regulator [Kiritimatiellae bacterium]|nr:response regulator [Kiritimatiellia bacterium]